MVPRTVRKVCPGLHVSCKESKEEFLREDAKGTGGTFNSCRTISCSKWSGQRSGS